MSTITQRAFHSIFGPGELPPGADGAMYAGPRDRQVLVALAQTLRPRRVVEIGVQRGLTAACLLAATPSIEVYTGVDVRPGYRPPLAGQAPEVPGEGQAGELAMCDSRFWLALFDRGTLDVPEAEAAAILGVADLVYIDGDHSAEGVRRETAIARSILRAGATGCVVWHDYGNRTVEVSGVIDEINRAEGDRICLVEGTWVAFELRPGVATAPRPRKTRGI
jgi:hypothetical protein